MSYAIPTAIPAQIRAGSTLTFKISLPDFTAPDWSITYSFRTKEGMAVTFDSADSGSDHLVTVAFATTAGWQAGVYSGVGLVTDGTSKFEFWRGKLEVLADVAASADGADLRTQNRRTLDNILAVLESRASSTILSSSVEGTSLGRIPHADLLLLRDRYATSVANEENAEIVANGGKSRKNIFCRFTTPR